MKILHYLNQFFGGVGGEEKADVGLEVRRGPVGPGLLLQRLADARGLSPDVVTVICGDTYAAEHIDEVADGVAGVVAEERPDVLVAGPAFFAGRYGLVCGELAARIPDTTGVPAVTAMYEENAAVGLFRARAHIVQSGPTAATMGDTMEHIVALLPSLAAGEAIADPEGAGLFGSGARHNVLEDRSGADRAVDALVALLTGEQVGTELAIPDFDSVSPSEPVADLASATVALVTEGGLVPLENPDHLSTGASERWGRYSVRELLDRPEAFHSIHGGYDTKHVNASPFRLLPADTVAALVAEGRIGKLHPYYYVTSGTATKVENCRMMGSQIAQTLRNEGVDAVVLTST